MHADKKIQNKLKIAVLLTFVFTFVATLSFLLTAHPDKTAATVAGFNAGNIMSDYVMGDYNSMSEASIQAFLKSKNHCNNREIYKASWYPTVHYNIRDGHFVCMADDLFNGETAAHIIWQAAQDYRINPKVLIVLLEKEQGLITDTWPHSGQYRAATGFGCPDTAACDSQYFGLKNQIRNSANLFRSVLNGGWTNYPVGWNYIQYSPNKDCGGSNIYIANRATSALYRYTPYQPNAGALANHPGTAYCGAYGNRNFYSFFTDWFGSTTAQKPPLPYEHLNLIDVDNAEYRIATAIDRRHFLDISGASFAENAKIQLYEKWSETNKAQIWTFESTGNHQYYIKSSLTQKYLTINKAQNGAQTIQQSKTNACTQKWLIAQHGDNVSIHSACDKSFALDVSAAKSFSGARTQVYERWSLANPAQEWQLEKVLPNQSTPVISDGKYRIITDLDRSKYLDVENASMADNAKIQLFEKWSETNKAQIWDIKHLGDNVFSITSALSGKLLSIHQVGNNKPSVVFTNGNTIHCGQKWKAVKTGEAIRFYSSCNNNYALDVSNALAFNRNKIQIFKDWSVNNKAQDWKLEPVVPSQLIKNGTYRISTALTSSQFLDVQNASMADNAKIQLFEKWSETNKAQIWDIYHQGEDNYIIKSTLSGKVLTTSSIQNSQQITLTNLQNNQCSQLWKAIDRGHNIIFVSACDDRYALDVSEAMAFNRAKVQLYFRWIDNNLAQEWRLHSL